MTTINSLSQLDVLTGAEQIPVYSTINGDARKTSIANIATYVKTGLTSSTGMITQYSTPTSTGFTININDNSNNTWLVLTPTATFANGTIKFPAINNAVDQQEILINTTQTITALSINGNGAGLVGMPTTLLANTFFKVKFEGVSDIWYRIG